MLSLGARVHVCQVATDMRCSFEGLSYRVREILKEDPLSGHLFVFFNRNRDKVKVLYFDRSGYAIWYKELQRGTFSCLTRSEISSVELACILEGLEIEGVRKKKRFSLRFSHAHAAPV